DLGAGWLHEVRPARGAADRRPLARRGRRAARGGGLRDGATLGRSPPAGGVGIEGWHGFAGPPRALGGLGGHVGAPHFQRWRSSTKSPCVARGCTHAMSGRGLSTCTPSPRNVVTAAATSAHSKPTRYTPSPRLARNLPT